MAQCVETFDFYPPPSTGNRVKCSALSYGGELRVSFGSLIADTEIERLFFTGLRKKGICSRLETNRF